MSSSIPSPACRPARRLVPVPPSSRIGYRMIPPRNQSHAIPDTTTPRPSHRPHCFPPRFPLHRVARRVGLKPDAIRFATRLACPPCLLTIISLIAPSHRLIRSARCFPALSAARRRSSASRPMLLIHLIRPPISSGSSLVPPRFPLCFPPGVPHRLLARLAYLIHLIRFAPSHWLIALPHRMRRATSRQNGAWNRQSTMRSRAPRHPTPHRYRKCLSPPAV